MADAPILQVVLFRDGAPVGTEVFLPGEYTIGSDPACELLLADDQVAANHATLRFQKGVATVEDLTGSSGIVVNGEPTLDAVIAARDDVAIGPFLLKFRVVAKRSSTPRAGVPAVAKPTLTDPNRRRVTPAPKLEPEADLTQRLSSKSPPAAHGRNGEDVTQLVADVPVQIPEPTAAERTPPRRTGEVRQQLEARTEESEAPPRPPSRSREVRAPTRSREVAAPILQEPPTASMRARPQPSAEPRAAKARQVSAKLSSWRDCMVQAVSSVRPGGRVRHPVPVPNEAPADQLPSLRVRVFWGKTMVGVHGYAHGAKVRCGPKESVEVPLYGLELPKKSFVLARSDSHGQWIARAPEGAPVFLMEAGKWREVEGQPDKGGQSFLLDVGQTLRVGNARHSVELRSERVPQVPKTEPRDWIDPQIGYPFVGSAIITLLLVLVMFLIPKKESSDFNMKKLEPVRALLKPPEKKKEKKKPEPVKKEEEKVEKVDMAKKEREKPVPDQPKQVARGQVNSAMKAISKLTAAPAVESLLKATSKLAGGPKGYGDKGMGYKLSPLIGKPPIAMAGMGFGPGAGGFGTATKGMGALRGMGGGGGGGIGMFASGGTGKGKVAGTVVSAPAREAKVQGMLPREAIAKVINEHLGEVRACYERALLKEAGLAGRLVLEWTIDMTGRVSEIKTKQVSLRGPEVPNCIISSLRNWVFPKPTGGKVVVSYPFIFNSVGF